MTTTVLTVLSPNANPAYGTAKGSALTITEADTNFNSLSTGVNGAQATADAALPKAGGTVSGTANFAGDVQQDGISTIPCVAAASSYGTTVNFGKGIATVADGGTSALYRRINFTLSAAASSTTALTASIFGSGALGVPIVVGGMAQTSTTAFYIDVIYYNGVTPVMADLVCWVSVFDRAR